jgi:uncharacterized DUF497 family protein
MRITYDPTKRLRTLAERGLDFEDASAIFDGQTVEIEDPLRITVRFAWFVTAICQVGWSSWAM